MKIGFIGLGKLGMPVATAMSVRGHEVVGYDVAGSFEVRLGTEAGADGTGDFADFLALRPLPAASVADAADGAEIIFIAVQTPHGPEYEGVTPLPDTRSDFFYGHLEAALRQLAEHATDDQVVAVISTVLPGTTRRLLADIPMRAPVVYNPSFIAMGTTMCDFLEPEFVLLGGDDERALGRMRDFYETITHAPKLTMAVESAELAKVAYNTAISLKIALANVLGHICHELPGADVDEVTGALAMARRRVASGAYLRGGMGDGGACHPRDNIAMSWLARELGIHYDLFEASMQAREEHARWLASLLMTPLESRIYILGTAYKANSAIETGSHALLVANILKTECNVVPRLIDPVVGREAPVQCGAYLLGCPHDALRDFQFPAGSVVIDPWGVVNDQENVHVIRIGRK